VLDEQSCDYSNETVLPDSGRVEPSSAALITPHDRARLTLDQFIAEVIYDGRFMNDFTMDPEFVAKELGVGITPEIVEEICGRSPSVVLAEVTEKMTRDYGERIISTPGPRPGEPQAWFVAVIAVAIICLGLKGDDSGDSPFTTINCKVLDESPNADQKE
jgi:hypothetical protein